jgi:hypothetical protein
MIWVFDRERVGCHPAAIRAAPSSKAFLYLEGRAERSQRPKFVWEIEASSPFLTDRRRGLNRPLRSAI